MVRLLKFQKVPVTERQPARIWEDLGHLDYIRKNPHRLLWRRIYIGIDIFTTRHLSVPPILPLSPKSYHLSLVNILAMVPVIVVLGAGVIGLSTAIEILDKVPDARVYIVAEVLPGDPKSIKYTSFWAVGSFLFTGHFHSLDQVFCSPS